jgi:L-lactate dehydrogenase complex protein LldF
VKINLHELLLENRAEAVEQNHATFVEKMAWKFWKKAMLNRNLMNMGSGKLKGWMVKTFVKDWKKQRSDLQFPKQSFSQQWVERNKKTG